MPEFPCETPVMLALKLEDRPVRIVQIPIGQSQLQDAFENLVGAGQDLPGVVLLLNIGEDGVVLGRFHILLHQELQLPGG